MNFNSSNDPVTISSLTIDRHLETPEEIRQFELLRLAFFTLRLRKLEQRIEHIEQSEYTEQIESAEGAEEEHRFHCNLLRHAIFQQVLTLTNLDARSEAMQLIAACRK